MTAGTCARLGLIIAGLVFAPAPALAAPPPRTHIVVIDKMKFGPVPANVRAGDVILWVNRDLFRHTATARDRSFDVDLAPGARSRTRVTHGGTVRFYCKYHPGMAGSISIARR